MAKYLDIVKKGGQIVASKAYFFYFCSKIA